MWERNTRKLIFHFPHAFWNVRIQTFKFFSSWCMYHLFFKTAYKIWYEIKLLKSLRKWFSILVREWRSCFFRVTQHTMGSLICHWNCIILVWNGHFDVGIDLVVRTMKLSKRTQKHLALESPLCQVPFRNGKIELLVSKASIQMHT